MNIGLAILVAFGMWQGEQGHSVQRKYVVEVCEVYPQLQDCVGRYITKQECTITPKMPQYANTDGSQRVTITCSIPEPSAWRGEQGQSYKAHFYGGMEEAWCGTANCSDGKCKPEKLLHPCRIDWPEQSSNPPAPTLTVEKAVRHKDDRIYYCGQGAARCDHGEHMDKGPYASMCTPEPKLEASCGETRWTCSNPSATLLESIDGKQHWCLIVK